MIYCPVLGSFNAAQHYDGSVALDSHQVAAAQPSSFFLEAGDAAEDDEMRWWFDDAVVIITSLKQ